MRYRHSTIKPTLITSYTPTLRSAELPNRLESNFQATLWNHSYNFLTRYHRHSVYRHRIRDHTNENTTLICKKWHLLYNHSTITALAARAMPTSMTNGMQCYQAPRGHQQGIMPTQASRTTPHPKPIKKLRDIIPPYQPFFTLYTHIRGLGAAKLYSDGLFHTPIPPRTNRLPFQVYDFYVRTFVRLISSFSRNWLFFPLQQFPSKILYCT